MMKKTLFGALVCAVCLLAACRAKPPEVTLPDASSQSAGVSQPEPAAPRRKGEVPQQEDNAQQPDNTPAPVEQSPPAPQAVQPDLGWNSFNAQPSVDPPAVDPDPAARAAFAALLEERLSEGGQFALCGVTGLGTEDVVAWSHNAGKGGRFWPYIHYRYSPAYRVYSPAGNVDAFDRQLAEDNGFLDQYPQEADTSNAGFVYYFIDEEGSYSDPVDLSYYRDWWEGYFHNVSPMKLPLWDLTEASISALT